MKGQCKGNDYVVERYIERLLEEKVRDAAGMEAVTSMHSGDYSLAACEGIQ